MKTHTLEIGFFILLIVGVLTLTFFIFKPYMAALFLAIVFAILFDPVYEFFVKKINIKSRKAISALITVLIMIATVLIPLIFFGSLIFKEASALVSNNSTILLGSKAIALKDYIENILPVSIDVAGYVKGGLNAIVNNVGVFFAGFLQMTVDIFLIIVAMYFFLKDGKEFKHRLVVLSPLSDNYDEGILEKVRIAINSVIRGAIIIAFVQGILTAVGFLFFGVPNPALWGGVAVISSLIPILGTSIIIIPAIIYLFVYGHTVMAIGLLIWSILIIGLVDNFLRPMLIEHDVKIHPFIILLSVFGGIVYLGPIGFLAGPVVLSLLVALFEVYPLILPAYTNE
jgi:predicted PurR-regulated permease PerM